MTDSQYDIDGDGAVSITDRDHWVHSSAFANTYFGDSNLDGEFNSGDLTLDFSAGEYEDNVTLNSSWAEGDWNGDGDFDSGDLVAAFTALAPLVRPPTFLLGRTSFTKGDRQDELLALAHPHGAELEWLVPIEPRT